MRCIRVNITPNYAVTRARLSRPMQRVRPYGRGLSNLSALSRRCARHLAEIFIEPAGFVETDVVSDFQNPFPPLKSADGLADPQPMPIIDRSDSEIPLELSRQVRVRDANVVGNVADRRFGSICCRNKIPASFRHRRPRRNFQWFVRSRIVQECD